MDLKENLNTKKKLIDVFLVQMSKNIIDVSYNQKENILTLQIVLLDGSSLSDMYREKLKNSLSDYVLNINIIFVSKDLFNSGRGHWIPSGYTWLENVLYSKAEIL